ncbi:MAG: hypothetical protein KME42_09315 [Tildeniella nuda ZEHNDER 1965/U140]|nr:hypothetical protein [Tildeniella nuda ZEHNDER 1965/U140]
MLTRLSAALAHPGNLTTQPSSELARPIAETTQPGCRIARLDDALNSARSPPA